MQRLWQIFTTDCSLRFLIYARSRHLTPLRRSQIRIAGIACPVGGTLFNKCIQRVVYGADHLGSARIAARVADLRAKGHEIEGKKHLQKPTIFMYRLVPEEPETLRLSGIG